MRYRKGAIDVNSADEAILSWVMQCGFVSTEQLWRFLSSDGCRLPRRTFLWRLQRLSEHGLTRRCNMPTVAKESVYAIDALGVAHMMSRGEFCAGASDHHENGQDGTGILHALDLNDIRWTLQESGVLRRWRSDTEIRTQNEFTTFGYAKDYDAVVTVRVEDHELEFALEYERMPKAGKKYTEIRNAVEAERRVNTFLYLTANFHILNFVAQFFARSRRRIYFGLLSEFRSEHLNMHVVDPTGVRDGKLGAVLLASEGEQ